MSHDTTSSVGATIAPSSNDLLSVEQAADYLQVSISSIRNYIRQGTLKAFRVAGKRKMLITREALLRLLEPTCNKESFM